MTMTAKYAGRCRKCGTLMPVGTTIDWDRARGATHHDPAQCVRQTVDPPAPINLPALVALLPGAQARGLRWPKFRFLGPDGRSELRLSMAGPNSRYPGVHVKLADQWQGYVDPTGQVGGDRLIATPALLAHIAHIASNPAEAAAAYGAV